jgi:DNA-binding phage protein
MENTKIHWTENGIEDYLFRIGADFVFQLENKIGSQKDFAKSLQVTEGAVSQKLNKPGNLKLHTMIKYARALGLKLSVVLYDDGDSENKRGPVNADVFRLCWEKAGKPTDFWMTKDRNSMETAFTDPVMPRRSVFFDEFADSEMNLVGEGNG